MGEIDIVRRRRTPLIFVEVKQAIKAKSVTPCQRQPIAAAEAWLATYPDESIKDIRFDAILVATRNFPRHIGGIRDMIASKR